jgi:uncharacterized protein (DUF983 family)
MLSEQQQIDAIYALVYKDLCPQCNTGTLTRHGIFETCDTCDYDEDVSL